MMKDKSFSEGLIEGAVSMTVSVVAMYIGTALGLKARRKLAEMQADERIDDEEVYTDEDEFCDDLFEN